MINNDIQKTLIEFIREEIGEFKKEIDNNSLLEDDLGVTGDEAIELIKKIGKVYNIDLSDFNYGQYFHPEPNFFNSYGKVKPFRIIDILNGIENKKMI